MTVRLHYGVAVAVFYTAFASATVGFVAFAMTQEVQLVSRDYYERSLQHDSQMRARANAEMLGDGLKVAVDHSHGCAPACGPPPRPERTWPKSRKRARSACS